jgi:hypothetical protein
LKEDSLLVAYAEARKNWEYYYMIERETVATAALPCFCPVSLPLQFLWSASLSLNRVWIITESYHLLILKLAAFGTSRGQGMHPRT